MVFLAGFYFGEGLFFPEKSSRIISQSPPQVSCLTQSNDPWAATDLLVPETVRGTIEPADVEALRFVAGGVAGDDDSIARLQGLAGHADFG